jgi:hypothetical protein
MGTCHIWSMWPQGVKNNLQKTETKTAIETTNQNLFLLIYFSHFL